MDGRTSEERANLGAIARYFDLMNSGAVDDAFTKCLDGHRAMANEERLT